MTLEKPRRETQDGKQGKMLLHTEYSLLSLLKDQEGVVHHHGLFKARSRGGSKIFNRVNQSMMIKLYILLNGMHVL